LNQTGVDIGNQDFETLQQLDAQLRNQAANSPIGNLAAATQRLHRELGFAPESPAARALERIQAGDMPFRDAGTWLAAMQASGIDPATARMALSAPDANMPFHTPETIDAVRQVQQSADLNPMIARYESMLTKRTPGALQLARGN